MRVNIYYGGRGLIDDPTLFAIEKITKVLVIFILFSAKIL